MTPFVLPEIVLGMIVPWSGSIISIPSGWSLCDGTNGTPDLRDRFLQGAGSTYAVDDTAGSVSHTHDFTSSSHLHSTIAGAVFEPGGDKNSDTTLVPITGTSDAADNLPLYYSLAYIMYTG